MKFLFVTTALLTLVGSAHAADEPNILWIFAEDTSPWMGCYDDEVNAGQTPNIDSIAARGVRFARAYVPAPVCSACRSALMGGQNQIRFGAHEHRSSRAPDAQLSLPKGMKLLPQIMQKGGYFTANLGKTDYNFVWDQDATYTAKPKLKGHTDSWDTLKENQPFFVQMQTRGGKNRTTKFPVERRTDPGSVTVPADYPDNEIYRETVAQHYDAIRTDDDHIGKILEGLTAVGLEENTIVVYFSDHGANHLVRHKQMPTEGGLHVPFVVMGPVAFVPEKGVRNDLVSMLDLSATTLAWANLEQPSWYEGRDLFAKDFQPREFVASAKDRLDHTIDQVRTIRTNSFRYTRNYKLDRVLLQPQYRDGKPYLENLKELYSAGELSEVHKKIFFGEREPEELYEVSKDPHQLVNLAGNSTYKVELQRHRKLLDHWLATGDKGTGEESPAALRHNGDDWQGGRGVNPEYEINRPDNDGDGLSDKWEEINGRDPSDGRLYYEFDCGGWQTEGWEAIGLQDNIAGFQGYLDFTLGRKKAGLKRSGLNAAVTDDDDALLIRLRSSGDLKVQPGANGKPLGQAVGLSASRDYQDLRIPLRNAPVWKGSIKSLQLDFHGRKGDLIEIDSIQVTR
jgi:N-sulfoglucosamine sulfohydrolase